ncbi:MAG: molybdopterin dinucleotide binding domain-containing protein, partial [Nitrospinota bacterium]
DPVCSAAASRAEEWIPIRPGTDAALILGMVNLMINENGRYDKFFLRKFTNAPYLIGEDEFYVRDPETQKPLVWDSTTNSVKPFDADVGEYALEGRYEVNGKRVKTAFQALKEHATRYTPDYVEEITTVPRETVVRLAREYGEAARIGETIEIDGVELPYRPATVTWYRGLSAHKHSFLAGLAVNLLPTLIGGLDVPGGLLGDPYAARGRASFAWRGTRKYQCAVSPDGFIIQGGMGGGRVAGCYPPRKVRAPVTPEMFELLPVGPYGGVFYLLTSEYEEKYKPPPFPKMLIQYHSNIAKTSGPPDVAERFLKRIPFIVSITRRMEETAEFADIVLPDLHHLERLVPFVYSNYGSGEGRNTTYGAKPVVHPPFEHPFEPDYVDVMQILLELAKRAGFLSDFYEAINVIAGLNGENRLDPQAEYTYPQIVDRMLKNELGPDKGLEWFMEDGLWTDEKLVEEKYPRPFVTARSPIYYEFMKGAGEDVRRVTEDLGIPWDTQDYQVQPDWKPGPAYKRQAPHNLYVINMKVPNHALSHTHKNPLLQSVSARHNDLRTVWINTKTAAERGIADGDWVIIETFQGRQQRAIAKVTELVHPEVLATQGCGGGWRDTATRQEVNFNALLAIDEDHIDFVNGALDAAISARVLKAD